MQRRQLEISHRAQRVGSEACCHGSVANFHDRAEEELYLARWARWARWTGARFGEVHVQGHLVCGVNKAAVETGDGIPILGPLFNAMRLHELAVALGGEAPALDFVVGSVIVAEDGVPDAAAA